MSTQKLIMAFVTLIIGVALIGVVATEGSGVTEQDVALNETFSILSFKTADNWTTANATITLGLTNVYATTDWQWNDCTIDITLMSMPNGTAAIENTDFNVTVNGVVALYDTEFWRTETAPNNTIVTYTYCDDDYISLGWGRTIINIVPGFFAIALLMVSLGMFYSVAKDAGII